MRQYHRGHLADAEKPLDLVSCCAPPWLLNRDGSASPNGDVVFGAQVFGDLDDCDEPIQQLGYDGLERRVVHTYPHEREDDVHRRRGRVCSRRVAMLWMRARYGMYLRQSEMLRAKYRYRRRPQVHQEVTN